MAIGQASFVAGDVMWNWYEIIGEDPFPSFADVMYLAGYPFIAAGLFLLIRRRMGGGDRGGLLDAAILTTACAILSWTFLIQPQLVGTDLDALYVGISLAYPVADLLLIGVAMGLLTTPAHGPPRSACWPVAWCCWSSPTRSTRSRTSKARTSRAARSTRSTSCPT